VWSRPWRSDCTKDTDHDLGSGRDGASTALLLLLLRLHGLLKHDRLQVPMVREDRTKDVITGAVCGLLFAQCREAVCCRFITTGEVRKRLLPNIESCQSSD
jgi:hypothetical protein